MPDNMTILIIEDNDLNLKLVRTLLLSENYPVLEATDAEMGLQLARDHHPAMILMDIQLPGMNGLDATRIIKKDPLLRDIRVVALTSFAMQGDLDRAIAAGCDGYITKPIDTRKFIVTIKQEVASIRGKG
jgi:CheY-like chemotaxis protein